MSEIKQGPISVQPGVRTHLELWTGRSLRFFAGHCPHGSRWQQELPKPSVWTRWEARLEPWSMWLFLRIRHLYVKKNTSSLVCSLPPPHFPCRLCGLLVPLHRIQQEQAAPAQFAVSRHSTSRWRRDCGWPMPPSLRADLPRWRWLGLAGMLGC